MSAEYCLDIARFKDVDNFVPVTQTLIDREVIDENNGLFCRSGANDRIEPQNFFAGNVRWSHTQTWSGATADETYSLPVVTEMGGLENLVEHSASVFTPVYIMVAGDEKIRFPEVLQNVLQQIKFLGVTEFSDIAAEDGEGNVRIGIDVFNGLPQVVFGIGERIEVHITEPCESEGSFVAALSVGKERQRYHTDS